MSILQSHKIQICRIFFQTNYFEFLRTKIDSINFNVNNQHHKEDTSSFSDWLPGLSVAQNKLRLLRHDGDVLAD